MTAKPVLGIDGCFDAWVVVTAPPNGGPSTVEIVDDIEAIVHDAAAGRYGAVGIDMPIGLPTGGEGRDCDREGRSYLGPRRSSIFSAPARVALRATDYPNALELVTEATGRGLSKQTYYLLPKIAKLDWAITLADGQPDALHEVHPECSFTKMNGDVPLERKKQAAGLGQRMRLLLPEFPDVIDRLAETPPTAAADDVLDAFAVAWSARRIALGVHDTLGDAAARDGENRRMTISV